jgi:predicted ATPase
MLKNFSFGNFKAFGDAQTIPIRPLTLIFGPNSAGKSSVLHSLLLACEANRTGEFDISETSVGGKSVDLGGFRQYVFRHDLSRRTSFSLELEVSALGGRLAQLLSECRSARLSATIGLALDNLGRPQPEAVPDLVTYEVELDGKPFLRMSGRPDGSVQLDKLEKGHPILRALVSQIIAASTTTEVSSEDDAAALDDAIDQLVPQIHTHERNLFPLLGTPGGSDSPWGSLLSSWGGRTQGPRTRRRVDQLSMFETEEPQQSLWSSLVRPVGRENRADVLAGTAKLFFPRLLAEIQDGLVAAITRELSLVQYLGPIRFVPPRHLAHAEAQDPNWFAGGGKAWETLLRDEKIRARVNAWLQREDRLQSRYEVVVREYLAADELGGPINSALQIIHENAEQTAKDLHQAADPEAWQGPVGSLTLFDPDEQEGLVENWLRVSDADRIRDLMLRDLNSKTYVSHRDVGFGISQVLPVLVYSYASQHMILAMEQPEIHLHPGLQAALADVFLESALGDNKNRFLLETHSEHLILRVLRRIRETTNGELPEGAMAVRPEDVAVLHVRPGKSGAEVVEIPIRPDGEFITDWPGGFFPERAEELF